MIESPKMPPPPKPAICTAAPTMNSTTKFPSTAAGRTHSQRSTSMVFPRPVSSENCFIAPHRRVLIQVELLLDFRQRNALGLWIIPTSRQRLHQLFILTGLLDFVRKIAAASDVERFPVVDR